VTKKNEAREETTPSQLRWKAKADNDLLKLRSNESFTEYYDFQKVLGEGAFCTVYQALDLKSGEQIAVKVIKRKNLHKEDVNLLRKEAELLQSI